MRLPVLAHRTSAAIAALAVVAGSVLVAAPAAAAEPAVITITSPADGVVLEPVGGVLVRIQVSDPTAQYTVEFDGQGPVDFSNWVDDAGRLWFSKSLANGWHTMVVEGGGGRATTTFLLDDIPPAVEISRPAAGEVVGATLLLDYSVGDGLTTWMSIDGAPEQAVGAPPHTIDVSGMSEGAHTVTVRSVDGFGNSGSATRTFVVDRTPPQLTVLTPAADAWVSAYYGVPIRVSSDEPLGNEWRVSVDGSVVRGWTAGGQELSYTYVPPGWSHGSSHTIAVESRDPRGLVGQTQLTVLADATFPNVGFERPAGTLVPGSVLRGSASDVSGIASVEFIFLETAGGECTLTELYRAPATVDGTQWELVLPNEVVSGEYCIGAAVVDGAGNSVRAYGYAYTVTVDATGPDAPTGLAPTGTLWTAPKELSWSAVADAARYEYRLAADADGLDTAPVFSVTATSAAPGLDLSSPFVWQVRGVDEYGNAGDWTDAQSVSVLPLPVIDGACEGLCGLVGHEFELEWSAVPGAVGYHVALGWGGPDHDEHVEVFELGADTDATIVVPADVPREAISLRVRAVLDEPLQGAAAGPWSQPLTYLHIGDPAKPRLLGPVAGTRVDGDAVELSWNDDPTVMLWELRISRVPLTDEDGGLRVDPQPLLDPMILLLIATEFGGEVPSGLDFAEIDALLGCRALEELAGAGSEGIVLPFPCADGSYTLPDALADGDYYWQVRGYGITITAGAGVLETAGPWSDVGHFEVGDDAPLAPGEGGSGTLPAAPTAPGSPTVQQPVIDEGFAPGDDGTDDADDASGDDGAAGGAAGGSAEGSGEPGDADEPIVRSEEAFPFVWLIVGLAVLVALAGAVVFIRFVAVRRG
ncbi:hypothetical protein H4J02_00985 [Protaetiibacter sp. SSC-01]|uniref:hypothetical protein n=1 Tax=Protaetiibacter sp. SSC-01 TaxID=2759943 RepID=UPI00165726A8|nr:hypothetical protein [Protaetiibacter sp. SSC-01]QNO37653.1 hypothetical protein H4J02_00985 [Protaetiibacter sp. SSC-01]